MAKKRGWHYHFGRSCVRGILLAVLVLLGSLCLLHHYGTPRWVRDEVLRACSRGAFALTADVLKLDLEHGLTFENVKIYRKRVPGQPCVEAREVGVALDLWALVRGRNGIREAVVEHAVFRPELARTPAGEAPVRRPAGDRQHLRFRLEVMDTVVAGLTVDHLVCALVRRGTVVSIEGARATISRAGQSGAIGGDASYDIATQRLGGRLDTSLDPHILLPLLSPERQRFLRNLVEWTDFNRDAPNCNIDFLRVCRPEGAFSLDARVASGPFSYRGVDVLAADGEVKVAHSPTNSVVVVRPLTVVREEGRAEVGFSVLPRQALVEFDADSTLDPAAGFSMIGILTNLFPRVLTFDGSVRINASGRVDYRGLEDTDFQAEVFAKGMSVWGFRSEECEFKMQMTGATNAISDLYATIYGGTLSGAMRLVFPREKGRPPVYAIDANVNDAAFEQVAERVITDEEYRRNCGGRLSGTLSITGTMDGRADETAIGVADMRIEDGRVFTLPIFGGLSRHMARIIPGLDFVLRQSDADATFTIGAGKVHSDKLQIQGDVFSLTAQGDYYLNRQLDYYAQVKLMKDHHLVAKLIRVLTYPISKLFEFRLRGTPSDPKWYPTNFSKDLLDRLGLTGDGADDGASVQGLEDSEP